MKSIYKSLPMLAIFTAMMLGLQQKSFALTGTCDIYNAAGDSCVAAFSTVRALYGSYTGSLYQVKTAGGATKDIGVLSAGYVANAAAQDSFCAGTTCTIPIIYDQSGHGNNLTPAPGGSPQYGAKPDIAANADSLPIQLDGHKVYGLRITPNTGSSTTGTTQVGYRFQGAAKGVATGDNPETIYEVTDGTYYDNKCCFDFGNTETTPVAGAMGAMDAIYFGNVGSWDKGAGGTAGGPWIMADMEDGVFSTGGAVGSTNLNDSSWTHPYITAMLKNNTHTNPTTPGGPFTLEGSNATMGTLTTIYSGASPNGYNPMKKQGGIILGVGGDNSNPCNGNFYEGVMTKGYATTATDSLIQANIVAIGYGRTTSTAISKAITGESSSASLRYDPSNARVVIDFAVQGGSNVSLDIVDLQGRHVASIVKGPVSAGQHQAVWDAKGMPNGVYFAKLSVDRQQAWTGRIVLGD